MRRSVSWFAGLTLLLCAALSQVTAVPRSVTQTQAAPLCDRTAITHREITIDGKPLQYTAWAGRLPIRSMNSDEPHAQMFYVAYRVASDGGGPRPVTFMWGGGPSEAALLGVHTIFGPKHIVGGKMADNPSTLLAVTDLVFVDPVGTGFSRPTKAEYGSEFYNVLGDQASLAEFVRAWRAVYEAQTAPIFLYGVSYGTWRVSGVAELLEKEGIRVTGAILQSGGIQFGADAMPKELTTALRTLGRAASALYLGKLAGDVGTNREGVVSAAERWSRDIYAPALAKIGSLTGSERESIARQLSRLTGYPVDKIDRKTLDITPREYLNGLLPGKRLNTYDMRVVMSPATSQNGDHESLLEMVHYLRSDLEYRTDLAYLGIEDGYTSVLGPRYRTPGEQWDYNSATITPAAMAAAMAGEGPPGTQPWLRRAMAMNPKLKVLVGAGLYDSLNSCSANEELMNHIQRAEAANFTLKCYLGGHDFQRDPETEPLFIADMKTFITGTLASQRQ